MYSNSEGRKSVDSITPVSPTFSHRSDFQFHRQSFSTSQSQGRRGSTASSIHSDGGSLDIAPGTWAESLLESGQNAISTLLQPPIVRTGFQPHTSAPASSAHKPPTAKDIPPVTLTNIPHVDPAEFKTYLSQVGALHEQLRRIKEDQEDGTDPQHRRGSRQDSAVEDWDDGHLRPGKRQPPSRKSSVSSLATLSPVEAPSPVRRGSSGFPRRGAQGPPPLSTIPSVYFEDDFHLENPRTFDIVSERSEVVRPAPGSSNEKSAANGKAAAPRKALATNAILQEKLSWYMDTIEMHLISSISTASTTFFTALGSLKELHTEAAESVERIKVLRSELQALDKEIATKGLEIVQKQRRQENLGQLHDTVRQLKMVADALSECDTLVEAGKVEKALDGIDSLERLITGEAEEDDYDETNVDYFGPRSKPALIDLRGAAALRGITEDTNVLRYRIGKVYETNFVTALMGDLRRHAEEVSRQDVLMRWSSASMRTRGSHTREPSAFPTYLSSTTDIRNSLLGSLAGLQRARHIGAATQAFRENTLREVRSLIRRPLPSANDDDNESMMSSSTIGSARRSSQQERSSILARNLRSLDPEDAEELLIKVYVSVTETLRRLSTQVKVLLDVASSIGHDYEPDGIKSPPLRSPPFSPQGRRLSAAGLQAQEELHKALDISNLLGQAVDIAHDKIVKLLRVRTVQSTQLPLVWFLRYFTLNLHFANECEAISGRSGTSLKTVVNGQIRDFVQQHGDSEKQKLAQGMESDQWDAKDFTEKDAGLLGQILEASTNDPTAWANMIKVWTSYSDAAPPEVTDESQAANSGKAKIRSASIDSETFLLPGSAVLCLEGILHFLQLMAGIPSMATDISGSLIAYLQLFNSRCTQLILGAGATKSAGLKKITAKHLAVTSQALSFIATLIPHIREFVRRRAGPGTNTSNTMSEFDRVRRLFQEHQNQIYDKLIDIMSGRAVTHSRSLKEIDWEKSTGVVHPYMDTLVKETTTLHRNLAKNLPEGTVRFIMVSVFSKYKEQFGAAFRAAGVDTEKGRDSMLHDVEFFQSRLAKIDGFGDAGEHLKSIITAKTVKAPAAQPPEPVPSESKEEEEEEQEGATEEVEKEDKEGKSNDAGTADKSEAKVEDS